MCDNQLVESLEPDDPALALVEVNEESESSLSDGEEDEEENNDVGSASKDRECGTNCQPDFQHVNALKLRKALKRKRVLTLGLEVSQDASFYLSGVLEHLMDVFWDSTVEMAGIESTSDKESITLKLRHLLKFVDVDPSLNAVFGDTLMEFDSYCMSYVGPQSKRQRTIDERVAEEARARKQAERAARVETARLAREADLQEADAMDDEPAPEAKASPKVVVRKPRRPRKAHDDE